MTIVSKLSGKVLLENANGYEDLFANGYTYEESTCCIVKDGKRWGIDCLASEVRMSYREYKNKYATSYTRKGSYDPATKTISVFVSWMG